jgi:hypothetical protein
MIELPWPPSSLVPHARYKGGYKKANDTKKHRLQCGLIAKNHKPTTEFRVMFYPPCKRARDLMNTIGACKALIDGLQDAWGIDDNKFRIHWPVVYSEPVKGGKVVIIPLDIEQEKS